METATATSTAQHLSMVPTPSGNGTFSILSDGTLIGYPQSSAVLTWMYSDGMLSVTYAGNKMYHYQEVPFTVVARMLTAESIGKFVNAVVKPNYQYLGQK